MKTFKALNLFAAALVMLSALAVCTPSDASPGVAAFRADPLQALLPVTQPDKFMAAIATPTLNQSLQNSQTTGATMPTYALNGNDVYYNGQVCKPLFAPIVCLVANSPCSVVAAVPGQQTLVLEWHLTNAIAAGTAYFATGATPLTGTMTYPANGIDGAPFSQYGHFVTGTNAALNIYTTGTSNVTGGYAVYINFTP